MSTTGTTPTPDLDRFASIVETAAQHMAKHDSVTCFGPLADSRWPERDLYRARVRAVLTAVGYAALCERADAAEADRDRLAERVRNLESVLIGGLDGFQRMYDMDDSGDRTGFEITMPRMAFGSTEVRIGIEKGRWHVSYESNGRTYSASHDWKTAAMLTLICQRLGYDAVLTPTEESEDQ